ncbi:MAG: hypothetical protein ACO1SV_21170 [Fimbriimonas sp.]
MDIEAQIRAAFSDVEIDEALIEDAEERFDMHLRLSSYYPEDTFELIPSLMIGDWRRRHSHLQHEDLIDFFYLASLKLCPEGPPPHPKVRDIEKIDQRQAIAVLDLCTPEQIAAIVHWVRALQIEDEAKYEEPLEEPDPFDKYGPVIRCLAARASIPLPE